MRAESRSKPFAWSSAGRRRRKPRGAAHRVTERHGRAGSFDLAAMREAIMIGRSGSKREIQALQPRIPAFGAERTLPPTSLNFSIFTKRSAVIEWGSADRNKARPRGISQFYSRWRANKINHLIENLAGISARYGNFTENPLLDAGECVRTAAKGFRDA